MNKPVKKIDYPKWSFIIGTLIALPGAIVAIVTVPEIGCKVGWNSAACVIPSKEVDLITQSETGEALAGVKIQFIAKGAPEVQYTDSNGYAKVQLPSEGDVRVNLSKLGQPTQDFIINLANQQGTVRIIRFTQSGQPEVQPVQSLPHSPPPDHKPTPTPSVIPEPVPSSNTSQEQEGFLFQLVGCAKQSDQLFVCDLKVKNLQENSRELTLWTGGSRFIDSEGNVIPSIEVRLGSRTGSGNASEVFPSNISINGSVSFNALPKGDVVLIGLNFNGKRIEFQPNKQ